MQEYISSHITLSLKATYTTKTLLNNYP